MQRRSVFPPLLKTYAEDAGAVQSPSREPEVGPVSAAASGGKRNPESNRSGTNVGGQAPPGSLQKKRDRQPAKRSVLRDSREAELRMKRAEVETHSSLRALFGVLAWMHGNEMLCLQCSWLDLISVFNCFGRYPLPG